MNLCGEGSRAGLRHLRAGGRDGKSLQVDLGLGSLENSAGDGREVTSGTMGSDKRVGWKLILEKAGQDRENGKTNNHS